jgi:hypothetical protein
MFGLYKRLAFPPQHPRQGNSLIMIQLAPEILLGIDRLNILFIQVNQLGIFVLLDGVELDYFLFYLGGGL